MIRSSHGYIVELDGPHAMPCQSHAQQLIITAHCSSSNSSELPSLQRRRWKKALHLETSSVLGDRAMATSIPAAPRLLFQPPGHATRCTSALFDDSVRRLRHGGGGAAARALPRPAGTKSRSLGRVVGVRCGGGVDSAEALRSEVEASVPPRSVPVRVAYELQQAGHRYLDVRTMGEFSAGHPEGAVNIPYMNKTGSGMTKNTHFLDQVLRIFGKDDEIIVGCQSGKRSLMAATELCSAGFTAVTDIAGGFSSWRESELPIIQ